ncbi:MAG: adenosylmethionine-8-amino-7-oxononanoate aminotransferase, partial [Gammaproteobacteria bacterium]
EAQLRHELEPARSLSGVEDVRVMGAIGVIEMCNPVDMAAVNDILLAQGVWLRPFGKLIYTMPPYIINQPDLSRVTQTMLTLAAM